IALGNLRFGLAHYQQALASFERAKTIGELDVSSRVRRAMSATYVDKPKLALSWLTEDRDALKHLGSYHLALARTHVALSQPDEAIVSYRKASALEPQNPIPESEAGAVYEAIGFQHRATKAYFRALKRNGEHHPTLIRLGSILVSQGKVLDAIPYFERAKRLSPDNVVVLSRLGGAFSAAGMLPEAVSTLKAAIKLAPDRPELFSSLAEAAYRQGDLALAETQLRTAVSLDPSRTVDANALRYVVLMQEMVAMQCEGVKDAKAIQSTLQARWTHEGWSPDLVERELGRMLNDADALLVIDELSSKCSAKPTK
ncbi:MAG: tetratricopeptide repeat protein, partial [Myxococcota bacterium]|nr:tetratricopeptide repeat protein [Myxococcota bacterium]